MGAAFHQLLASEETKEPGAKDSAGLSPLEKLMPTD